MVSQSSVTSPPEWWSSPQKCHLRFPLGAVFGLHAKWLSGMFRFSSRFVPPRRAWSAISVFIPSPSPMIEIQTEMRSVMTGQRAPINLWKGVLIKQWLDLEDASEAGVMYQDKILITSARDSWWQIKKKKKMQFGGCCTLWYYKNNKCQDEIRQRDDIDGYPAAARRDSSCWESKPTHRV